MKKMLVTVAALTFVGFSGQLMAQGPGGDSSPLPGCTVAMVEAGVPACDPQGPEVVVSGAPNADDVDAADCSVEGECQGTATGNPEGEGAFDAGGDDSASTPAT